MLTHSLCTFQIQCQCTVNARNPIKCSLRKDRLSPKGQIDLNAKNRKYDDPEMKRQAVKKRYEDKKESKNENICKMEH